VIELFAHPFSSYCWKAMIAFHEKDVPFELRLLDHDQPDTGAEFARRWPLRMMPLLVDGDEQVMESSVIIEWLDQRHPEPPLIPTDPQTAIEVRMMDRIFDNYVMNAATVPVFNAIRPEDSRDPYGVDQAHARLRTSYAWLEARLADREWAAGDRFTLADCAAAPALFYADWVERIPDDHTALRAYRARLLARPSMARCVEGARPYRHYFPLGAPDRD
jgi:glutathione S-transferase